MQYRLTYILAILLSVTAYGQVNFTITPDKTDYNGKDIVNLTIVLELNGSEYNQQTPIRLPDLSKFNMIGTGSVNSGYMDPETNTVITQYITRVALEPKKKGKVKIGSVLVTINNKIYKTEPFDILVRDVEKKSLAASGDVYLNMEVQDKEVYQDQPTIAVLKVYSRNIDNFRKVKNIRLPHQENMDVQPVSFARSEIDPSAPGNLSSQVVAMFMIFPNESGSVEIPAVTASLNSYSNKNKLTSNKVKLSVKKLPEGSPEGFKNAVGDFNISVYNTSKERIEAKKPVNVIVKVSGEGNLTNMELPKILPSPDYEVFAPKITSKVVPGTAGIKGEILANYIVIPRKAGLLSVKTEPFAFFNPEHKEYVDLGQKMLPLTAMSHEQVLEARTTVEKVNEYTNNLLETVDTPVLKTTSFKVKEKDKFHWNILLVNVLILLGLFGVYMIFRNWKKKQHTIEKVTPADSLGSVAETEERIRESMKTDINDYFSYLENLKDSGDYQRFFQTADELDAEVRKQYQQNSSEAMRVFLETDKGTVIAEEYRNLLQKIQIEKYAPVKSAEALDDLLTGIVNFYSQISK
ncbi:BatD family protein [uncultured Chryseobacterium sp.]|uniref:BatD family protein n=1 Tax=uncultured Chryseobacterium sp. TaxID=259322 RepID=UPI00374A2BE6